MWQLKIHYTQIQTILIQSCDWFTAPLASAVNSAKCKLHHTNRHHQNTPAVLPAQRTGHGAENAKAEGEMTKPHFCTWQV